MKTIGERLREAREQKNYKQIHVMKKVGINNKTLSGYENGVSKPDYDTLKTLAKLYEVSLDELITGIDDDHIIDEEVASFKKTMKGFYEEHDSLNNDIYKLLHHVSVHGVFKAEYEKVIFNCFRDNMSTYSQTPSDYEYFDNMYNHYLQDKSEDPSYIDEQFEEEFTHHYNLNSVIEAVRASGDYEWKEEIIFKLRQELLANGDFIPLPPIDVIKDNNSDPGTTTDNPKLEEILLIKNLTYRNKPLTDHDRQRILEMLKLMFPDRQ
ncbi:helix-turn-helix domain-containing protein [Paenibacillus sp. NPDC057934]|uniref:helix-turn-helix domain-containing protein n=1 Tax=Paenibacillus sp. NPDC057934 TaxID=3346282 RepID=UPI0036DDD87E